VTSSLPAARRAAPGGAVEVLGLRSAFVRSSFDAEEVYRAGWAR
jgi:hypothetical protein